MNVSRPTALSNDRGAALIVTLVLLLGLAAMASTAVMLSSTDLTVAGNDRQHQDALGVAEAGVAEAITRLSLRPGTLTNVNGVDIDASITDPNDPPDPEWRARIFLTDPGSAPEGDDEEFHTGTVQPPGDYMEYGHATDPERAINIQHKLRDFDGDGTEEVVFYDSSMIPPENPFSGTPVERITVEGRSGSATRVVRVDAIRFPLSINVKAALLSDGEVDLRGNVTICGHNHEVTTPAGTQLPSCSPAWDTADGHLEAVVTTGDPVTATGSTDLLGSPTATNTQNTNTFMSLAQTLGVSQDELNQILSRPDQTSPGGVLDGITVLTGDYKINGIQGSGLLYVDGDLDLAGNGTFRGLVYVEGSLKNTGNNWILGAAIVRGSSSVAVDFGAGTPAILYSRDILQETLAEAMSYVVLAWKEM